MGVGEKRAGSSEAFPRSCVDSCQWVVHTRKLSVEKCVYEMGGFWHVADVDIHADNDARTDVRHVLEWAGDAVHEYVIDRWFGVMVVQLLVGVFFEKIMQFFKKTCLFHGD